MTAVDQSQLTWSRNWTLLSFTSSVIIGTLEPYTEPFLCRTMGEPREGSLFVSVKIESLFQKWSKDIIVLLCVRTPIVSSKVMALMLSDARMASLSASVGSSLEGTLAERMTHMSHRFTFTARRSALLRGEPCKEEL